MTETGMSLGTPHYMCARAGDGRAGDRPRSDVYALGAVTYEMLAGEPPFTGPTAQAIVAKVMTERAGRPRAPSADTVPAAVEDAVLTALAKLPADRFATAAEFAARSVTPTAMRRHTATRAAGGPRARSDRSAAIVGVVAFGIGLGGQRGGPAAAAPGSPPVVLRYAMTLPDSAALVDHTGSGLAYAPDGSVFAYTSRLGLMLRAADRLDVVPVAGAREEVNPFFSPTAGGWGIWMVPGWKVPLAGGAPVTICDSCTGYLYSWGRRRHRPLPHGPPAIIRIRGY